MNPGFRKQLLQGDQMTGTIVTLPCPQIAELLSRIEESNRSAPYPDGRYIYQSRIDKGENYFMHAGMKRTVTLAI